MVRLIYNLAWPVGLLLFLPGYLVKMFRRGGYREKFGQRLGFYDREVRARLVGQETTWIHAVSVGELAVAFKLLREMRAREPGLRFALTTTTTTGHAFARAKISPGIELMYMPLDWWPIMRRAFRVIRPKRIILVEAEVWPNLMAEAKARRVPVALVNARLSPRSESRFRRFNAFVRPLFRQLEFVAVPQVEDMERWAAIGVESDRIKHTGSIKFDPEGAETPTTALPGVFAAGDLVLFGGSTHRGEEIALADIFVRLRKEFPQLRLFIAPRHVERTNEVRRELESRGLAVGLVTETSAMLAKWPDCLLLDKTGELQSWYAIATVAFVGKSLTAHGGQNPVEPIAAGVPVIFGPHMENFALLADALVKNGGALRATDEAELERIARQLLSGPAARQNLVKNSQAVLDIHRGATKRTAELVMGLDVPR